MATHEAEVALPYLPRRTPDAEAYWEGTRQGELRYQVCDNCGSIVFHMRAVCPYCLSDELSLERSAGRGSVYSFTVVHRPPNPAYAGRAPYVLAIVALDEGFHMFTEIVHADPGQVAIGQRVRVVFEPVTPEVVLPKFELEAEPARA